MKLRDAHVRSRETQLLLQGITPHADSERGDALRQTSPDAVNWTRLTELATYHNVLPWLYHNLMRRAPGLMPDEVQAAWKGMFEHNAQRNLLLTSELLRVGKLAASEDITIVPFKGPVLAQQLYGNLALRQFGDLDILVPRADIPHLDVLLRIQDYTSEHAIEHFGARHFEAAMRLFRANAFVYYQEERGIKMEIHWCFLPRQRLFPEPGPDFWGKLDTVSIGGMSFPALTPEHRLFYLAVHGSKHGWHRLSWLLDFAVAATTYADIDWATLYQKACQAGSGRMLMTSILASHDLLGVPVPPALTEQLEHDRAMLTDIVRQSPLVQHTLNDDAYASSDTHVGVYSIDTIHFQSLHRTRWVDKLRFWQEQFLLPRLDLLDIQKLPAALFPLYYLINSGVRLQRSARKLFRATEISG